MKKIIAIAFVFCLATTASAQSNDQIQNKNGVDMMPVSGEFSVGIGVGYNSLTTWIGNMFGYTNTNNSLNTMWINNPMFGGSTVSIWGKYMVSDNNAMRASLSNFMNDNQFNHKVFDDRTNNPDSVVTDRERFNSSNTYLSAGWEFRRGKTRVRGLYGGDAVLSWSNSHETYTYGNNLGATNLTPTQDGGMPAWNNTWGRTTKVTNGNTFGIGARAFVGVEFFVAPKICIGTEFGWSILYEVTGQSSTDYERFDPFADGGVGAIVNHTEYNLGNRSWRTGVDNFNSQLYVNFYF